MAYRYGSTGMGAPPSIASDMERRRQFEDAQYAEGLARRHESQDAAQAQYDAEQQMDLEVKRNRLGLGGLTPMLTDRYSNAYDTAYPSGEFDEAGQPVLKTPQEMGHPSVQMEIGPVGEGPVRGLGLSPLRPIPLGQGQRRIKPEFQDDLDALSSQGGRTRSVEEMAAIEKVKADERLRVLGEQALQRQQLAAQNNQSKSVLKAADIQAKGGITDYATLANDAQESMTLANQPRLGLSPMQAPAFSDAPTPETTVSPEAQALVDAAKQRYPEKSDAEILAALQAKGLI